MYNFKHNSYMNTIKIIQTPGLLSFGQFFEKKNKKKKKLKKGKINYRVFGFLHISSLVTCNKNKMGISR